MEVWTKKTVYYSEISYYNVQDSKQDVEDGKMFIDVYEPRYKYLFNNYEEQMYIDACTMIPYVFFSSYYAMFISKMVAIFWNILNSHVVVEFYQ